MGFHCQLEVWLSFVSWYPSVTQDKVNDRFFPNPLEVTVHDHRRCISFDAK